MDNDDQALIIEHLFISKRGVKITTIERYVYNYV